MKIAIIGTGITGLSAAYMLHPHHEITVFERAMRVGGHARTIDIDTPEGRVPVDTGFIVFNRQNYPHLCGLFEQLDVPIAKSNMSFGARIGDGFLEYSSRGVWAQRRNLVRPTYWRMLADIVRFNRSAHRYLEASPTVTLRMMIDDLHLGPWFRDYYLAAMGAAIWSMPLARMMDFPAHTLVRFFANHGLLAVRGHPQWYTVKGGSRTYVDRLTASFQGRIVTGCGVRRIRRVADGVTVWDDQGREHRFDRVVMAAHGDETLAMMDDADNDERRIFGAFKFSRNQVVVHDDVTLMPRARQAWASWVYTSESLRDQGEVVSLTYWMNNLQPLATTRPILITLNPGRAIAAQHIIDRHEFTHPIFDAGAIAAQGQLSVIQGRGGVYYAGAYWRYGFHEDGILSAVNVAVEMGITPPWM